MADRTTGELEAVKVGSLPAAPDIYDDTLIPVEQQGVARHITGSQWKGYATAAVDAQVDKAKEHAEAAKKSEDAAAESAKDAADIALHPPTLKEGNDHWWVWDTELNDYKDSGVDAGVSLSVDPETVTGEPGTPAKVENVGTATDPVLKFTLPQGEKGDKGDTGNTGPQGEKGDTGDTGPQGIPGVSPTVDVSKAGGTTTVTITDANGKHTAEIKDGEVTQEALNAALAAKQDALTFDDAPTEGSGNPVKSGGVWDALQRKPNRNLLDNWYFVGGGSQQGGGQFPINQRGQKEYINSGTLSYTIDRWFSQSEGAKVTINEGYTSFSGSGTSTSWFGQKFEYTLDMDATYTFSILTHEGVLLSIALKGLGYHQASGLLVEFPSENWINLVTTHGQTFNIVAAKLELGPVQTLAHKEGDTWVLNEIPDYGEELAKCQRYQIIQRAASNSIVGRTENNGSAISIFIPTPVTMRANGTYTIPKMVIVGNGKMIAKTSTTTGNFGASVDGVGSTFNIDVSGIGGYFPISIYTAEGFTLDANL